MKYIKKLLYSMILSTIMILSLCIGVHAAPIDNAEISLTQPDGTQLSCYASGDEYFNYLHDSNGNIIIQHPDTGYYVYAKIDASGKLIESERVAVNNDYFYDDNISSDLVPIGSNGVALEDIDFSINANLVWSAEEETTLPEAVQDNELQAVGVINSKPLKGKMENIVVMICFSDESPEIGTDIKNRIENVFNAPNASLKEYMKMVSQGVLEVNSTLVGMDGNTVLMYQDTHPRSYYRAYNSTTNPDGYQGGDNGSERTQREHELLKNVVNAINGSSLLEGKNLDIDGDGYVDSISFFVSGNVNGWNSLLWPHKWSLYSYNVKLNGKRVYKYSLQLVDRTFPKNSTSDLSVICHETLHVFGLPDLYRYSGGGNSVGYWDIMASNDKAYPQIPNSHSLLKYAGWGNSIVEVTGNGRYTLSPIGNTSGITAYGIKTNNPQEFILLEYRSERNNTNYNKLYKDSASSYRAGLTITRINTASNGNSNGSNEEVYVYRPNDTGYNAGTGSIHLASLSSNAGRTSFGMDAENADYSGSIYLNNGSNTQYVISNVSELGDTLSFDIKIEEDKDITNQFVDDIFLQEVRTIIGKTNDEAIYQSDIMNIEDLDLSDKDIQNLAGIEYFTGLKNLECYGNEFSTVDLSKNIQLEKLNCSYNLNLTALNISNNVILKELKCEYCKLSALNVTNNVNLTKLMCCSNQLNQINISKNTELTELDCSRNYLTTVDVSNNKKIKKLNCTNNYIPSAEDVIGVQETGLILNDTLKFTPQRKISGPSSVKDDSYIYPIDTTYVSQHGEENNTNFSGESVIKVNYTAKENNSLLWGEYAYLKFDVSDVPKEWIKSAKLRLYVENGTDYRKSTREIGVYDTYVNNWDGSTMTWSDGRIDSRTLISSFTVTATGYAIEDVGWREIDITDYLKNNCIDDTLSLMLKSISTTAYETTITSGVNNGTVTDNMPSLIIEYEEETDIMPVRTYYTPSADTYIYQHEPNNKFNNQELLSVNYTADVTRNDYWGQDAYLSFNIEDMTEEDRNNMGRAVLWIYVDENSDNRNSTRTINISANDGLKYDAENLTWSSSRVEGDVNISDITVTGNGYEVKDIGWRQIDVTEFIGTATQANVEFILKMMSNQEHPVKIRSMEYPDISTRPKLIIESKARIVDISDNYMTEIVPNERIVYKYIPKNNDKYILSSVDGAGSSVILLDENMVQLAISEKTDGEFNLKYDLNKGKKYYFKILSNSSLKNNYKLYIETPLELVIR